MKQVTMKITTTEGKTSESAPFDVEVYSCVGKVTLPTLTMYQENTGTPASFKDLNVTTSSDASLSDSRCVVTYSLEN